MAHFLEGAHINLSCFSSVDQNQTTQSMQSDLRNPMSTTLLHILEETTLNENISNVFPNGSIPLIQCYMS